MARQAESLTAALPELAIPPRELAEALAQVRRISLRLDNVEELLASLEPG